MHPKYAAEKRTETCPETLIEQLQRVSQPIFDGILAVPVHLEIDRCMEKRERRNALEINFCVNGRYESHFTKREHVTLTPGDMAVSTLDNPRIVDSESLFPLGYYEGLCLLVDCEAAEGWMREHAPAFATSFASLRETLLGDKWYVVESAGPRCEHVFRELYENLPYFDLPYLRMKTMELLMLLARIPRVEAEKEGYCSPRQLELVRHLRDHLLTDRAGYVSVAQLAEEHRVSVSYLQKMFRRVYGVPIYQYVKEYRLERAAVELATGRRHVCEIAADAGYDNASKFAASFRRRYGATPTAYRLASVRGEKRSK